MGHEGIAEKELAGHGVDQCSGVRRGGRGQVNADQQLPGSEGLGACAGRRGRDHGRA